MTASVGLWKFRYALLKFRPHNNFVSSASIWQHFNNLILKHMHALCPVLEPLSPPTSCCPVADCVTSDDAGVELCLH